MRFFDRVLGRRTLSRYLLAWLGAALLLVWAVQLAAAGLTGYHEAEEITDGQLIAVARLWLGTEPEQTQGPAHLMAPVRVRDYVQDVAVLRWIEGRLVTDTHGFSAQWPTHMRPGFSQLALAHGARVNDWRVYVTDETGRHGQERLAVLMDLKHRLDLGRDIASHLIAPSLLVLPLMWGLVALALRRGLKPLHDLSEDIEGLQGHPGERLRHTSLFAEFTQTVTALHGLMDRLDTQRERERAFASDLAHELRTPLTALALQSRALAQNFPDQGSLALEKQALRAGAILSQLLALARLESGRGAPAQTMALRACVAHVLSEMAQAALDSGHELVLLEGDVDVIVEAQVTAIELVVRNLVDNALRHTPAGSRVEVTVWQQLDTQGLSVEDWPDQPALLQTPSNGGPGEGLGLGLQLVQRLVESQGAKLRIRHKKSGGRAYLVAWSRAPGKSFNISANDDTDVFR